MRRRKSRVGKVSRHFLLLSLGKPTSRLQALDRKLKVPQTFAPYWSGTAHAQAEAQCGKSCIAFWNCAKLVLQTLGKLAGCLQSVRSQT